MKGISYCYLQNVLRSVLSVQVVLYCQTTVIRVKIKHTIWIASRSETKPQLCVTLSVSIGGTQHRDSKSSRDVLINGSCHRIYENRRVVVDILYAYNNEGFVCQGSVRHVLSADLKRKQRSVLSIEFDAGGYTPCFRGYLERCTCQTVAWSYFVLHHCVRSWISVRRIHPENCGIFREFLLNLYSINALIKLRRVVILISN